MSNSEVARYLIAPWRSFRDWIAWLVALTLADTAHSLVDGHQI